MNYGLDFSAIREMKFLREINHENIVKVANYKLLGHKLNLLQLHDTYIDNGSLHLVFEYCPTDLEAVRQQL